MLRKRNRKLTIDIMLEQAKFQQQHELNIEDDKTHVKNQYVSRTLQTTHKQAKYKQVQRTNENHINRSFLQQIDFFEIKIKGISHRMNEKGLLEDFQQRHHMTKDHTVNKVPDTNNLNPQEKIDHGGTLELVELMWTQNLKKQEIEQILTRQKYTMQTNDRNSSAKHGQLYQQLRKDQHQSLQMQNNLRISNDLKEKLYQQSNGVNFSQQNKQCCQIM